MQFTLWVVAAISKEITFEYEVISTTRIKTLNWLRYGLELFLTIVEEDFKDLPHVTLCRGKNINIVIEGRPHSMLQM